ncbi:MAG TPA: crosslink repair DNA glycosylase YcaQ family protein [Actinomycetota bacterium]|nr:crosslink repair DNA glycosylase YcaQ family protein [Actinomycetota bacterium]
MPPRTELTVSLDAARRLAVARQRLSGPRPLPDREGMLDVVRDLRYLQIDPINVVARSHALVLWSRLGPYPPLELESLRWEDRAVFEYWAHGASLVLTEDYQLHRLRMRRYPTDRLAHGRRTRAWLEANPGLRRHVLARLRRDGPLQLQDFGDRTVTGWTSGGWSSGRNVERMLDVLWTQGTVVVAGRAGPFRLWDLAERWFPEWTPRRGLPEREIVRRAAQHSLRALGVASPTQIQNHFTLAVYAGALGELATKGTIVPVRLTDQGARVPGSWFVHEDDVDLLAPDRWEGRTTLLSPFDNLIIDRKRTELLFGFRFRMEIYVPQHLRQHGYYVLPVLHGDRLIGRIDPRMDRGRGELVVNAVHVEPDSPTDRATARAVRDALADLAAFVGATRISFAKRGTERWSRWLG